MVNETLILLIIVGNIIIVITTIIMIPFLHSKVDYILIGNDCCFNCL